MIRAASLHNDVANWSLEGGDVRGAIETHLMARKMSPDSLILHNNLLRDYLHTSDMTGERLLEESRQWWVEHAAGIPTFTHEKRRDPDKRLRIGFLSPDFRRHPIAYFLRPLFEHYDRSAFELVGYSNVERPDEMTQWFRERSLWRNIATIPERGIAKVIHDDAIDILIDVAGFGARNMLRVFAYRPAPVQIAYMGYPATTGSHFIDWRITDAFADPPGMTEAHFSEKLWRLPRTAWCYWPLTVPDSEVEPPTLKNRPFTFGSFNNLSKLSGETVSLWAAILRRSPSSRLMLKARMLSSPSQIWNVEKRFEFRGIDRKRLILCGWEKRIEDHMARYRDVDLALDPVPYQGTATTCDALAMNVPVLTMAGGTHVSRVGVSLMNSVGLGELVAQNEESYVATAVGLSGNIDRLVQLRATLRAQLANSPLFDRCDFTNHFCAALRDIWRHLADD